MATSWEAEVVPVAAPGSRLRVVRRVGPRLFGWDGHGRFVVAETDERTARQVAQRLWYEAAVEHQVPG